MKVDPDVPPMHDKNAELENTLIETFLLERGHDPRALRARNDAEAHAILAEASKHATARLTDHECRAHYTRDIHGLK